MNTTTIKERPILMSGPMVRAIHAGTKTQTRRTIKTQPSEIHFTPERNSYLTGARVEIQAGKAWAVFEYTMGEVEAIPCPYGKPGDRLWVRETWRMNADGVWTVRDAMSARGMVRHTFSYRADADDKLGWFPSIHMPRWASRLTLEIVSVRVERLQDISEEDAQAEGCQQGSCGGCGAKDDLQRCVGCLHPFWKAGYETLWESINGPKSWEENPWVWVVTFKRVK